MAKENTQGKLRLFQNPYLPAVKLVKKTRRGSWRPASVQRSVRIIAGMPSRAGPQVMSTERRSRFEKSSTASVE